MPQLKPILKVIGAQTLVTPKILKLARWIGRVLLLRAGNRVEIRPARRPSAKRRKAGRNNCSSAPCPVAGELPKLPKRQQEVWSIVEERP